MTSGAKFISIDEARDLVFAATSQGPSQSVELIAAAGYRLAKPLVAKWSLPQDAVSVMDGFALRFEDIAGGRTSFKLIAESAAGHPSGQSVGIGQCARVSTGAVIPAGCDMVVAQEDTQLHGNQLTLQAIAVQQAKAMRFIRPAASEIAKGQLLLPAGQRLAAGELALAAGVGYAHVEVGTPVRVAICATGDELCQIGQTPARGQIVETNCLMLATQTLQAGGQPMMLDALPDDPAALKSGLERALAQCDILVTSGGISVGVHDIVFSTLIELGATALFEKVRLQPGKPTTVLRWQDKLVFCLPGNPASSHVAFELFVRPAILRKLGVDSLASCQQILSLPLADGASADSKREHFVRVRIVDGCVVPLQQQASGSLASIAGHHALARVPVGQTVSQGDLVDVWFFAAD